MEIKEEAISRLDLLGKISMAFRVDRMLALSLVSGGLGGISLTEVSVEEPWIKDYDAIKGEGPTRWADQFDVSNWGLLIACVGERPIGGAVVAFDTPGVDILEGRFDIAVLWDIRVDPEARSRGIGTRLFRAAEAWARSRGCRVMKIETQNINVAACQLYARQGCTLGAINRFAYADLPNEIQLIWYKQLTEAGTSCFGTHHA